MPTTLHIASRARWLGAVAVAAAAIAFRGPVIDWFTGAPDAPASSGEVAAFYTCSMDPSVRADRPGSCPICGMALTPVTHVDRASGVVHVAREIRLRIGLAVAPVERKPMHRSIAASGVVSGPASGAASGPTSGPTSGVVARVDRGVAGEIPPGQAVTVTAPELAPDEFAGVVELPRPGDPAGALPIAVADPTGTLQPGMRVDVRIVVQLPERLVVPAAAVIYAGVRRIVFVDRGDGRFEPREVVLGMQAGELVEVTGGLAAGDPVVVRGAFLLAADSRIRSDGALWSGRPPRAPAATPPRPPAAVPPGRAGGRP